MSTLDALIIWIIVVFLIRGIWVGFIRQMASILALVFGFIVAGRYYGESAHLLTPYISNKQVGFFIAYLLIFLIVFGGTVVCGMILKKVMHVSLLGWFDRIIGAFFGMAKGLALSCLFFMGLGIFISAGSPFFADSFAYPYLERGSSIILTLVKNDNLRTELMPRRPAIPAFITNTLELGKKVLPGNADADRKQDNAGTP